MRVLWWYSYVVRTNRVIIWQWITGLHGRPIHKSNNCVEHQAISLDETNRLGYDWATCWPFVKVEDVRDSQTNVRFSMVYDNWRCSVTVEGMLVVVLTNPWQLLDWTGCLWWINVVWCCWVANYGILFSLIFYLFFPFLIQVSQTHHPRNEMGGWLTDWFSAYQSF